MNPYLDVTGLEAKNLAGVLGVNETAFEEWAAGQRRLPLSMVDRIASILGVEVENLISPPSRRLEVEDVMPSIWFRLRGEGLRQEDKELVLLIRELGLFVHELDTVRDDPDVRWRSVFSEVEKAVDPESPPREQGRVAAKHFRSASNLEHGRRGVGGVIRSLLRSMGMLVVETPLSGSVIEGCAFYVGKEDSKRPCIFLNSARSTWFRRNSLLMHELAHAIFDARSAGATLDFQDGENLSGNVIEGRADAFAQEVMVPREVLTSVAAQNGIKWNRLDEDGLALLVAETQSEQQQILRACVEAGFLTSEQREDLREAHLNSRLKKLTDRALTTQEFVQKYPDKADLWLGKRRTTLRTRQFMLPVGYVKRVWEAQVGRLISVSRAAQMLMIGEEEYASRFDMTEPVFEEI